jgi:enoyl-CoA hydratase/carnithine racemase
MSEPGDEILQVATSGGVVRLTLNRPGSRNALSTALVGRLVEEFDRIAGDTSTRAVVLAANGTVFSAGHDLSEMLGRSEHDYRTIFGACSAMMQAIRGLPVPVIARVQGPALAAGCQLVAACDLVIAAEGASFSTPGIKIGLFCTTPMVPLVRAIPAKAAMEMLLTGEPIDASRARELGLINRVAPADRLDEQVDRLLAPILASSREVIRIGKEAFYHGLPLDEASAYEHATDVMVKNARHADAGEGIGAFLAKRRPIWTGSNS